MAAGKRENVSISVFREEVCAGAGGKIGGLQRASKPEWSAGFMQEREEGSLHSRW